MAFTGPGHRLRLAGYRRSAPRYAWPARAATGCFFGELPLEELQTRRLIPVFTPPARLQVRQLGARQKPAPIRRKDSGTVKSDNRFDDADRLLASFLPRTFRRPVKEEVRKAYVTKVDDRLKAGDSFETRHAMGLPRGPLLAGFSLSCRASRKTRWTTPWLAACPISSGILSPTKTLAKLAQSGTLHEPACSQSRGPNVCSKDPKSQAVSLKISLASGSSCGRFAADRTRTKDVSIPNSNPYLQDSMVAETRAYLPRADRKEPRVRATWSASDTLRCSMTKLATHYKHSRDPRLAGFVESICRREIRADRSFDSSGNPQNHRQRHHDLLRFPAERS